MNKEQVIEHFERVKSFGWGLEHWEVDEELWNNKEVVIAVVKQEGMALKYASDELKNDKDVVIKAIHSNDEAFKYVSNELRNDKEFIIGVVQQCVKVVQWLPDEVKRDEDFILKLIDKNVYVFDYLDMEDVNNLGKDVILDVVSRNGLALCNINVNSQKDKEIILAAIGNNGEAFLYANERWQNDRDVLNVARPYLMSNDWVCDDEDYELLLKARETLMCNDREDREDELLSKLADLDKLQAQQNSINQPKAEVKSSRKI